MIRDASLTRKEDRKIEKNGTTYFESVADRASKMSCLIYLIPW